MSRRRDRPRVAYHRLLGGRDPEAAYPTFTPERDQMEGRWLASSPEPAAAFREADAALARWRAGLPDAPDRRPWFVRRYLTVRNQRAGLPV